MTKTCSKTWQVILSGVGGQGLMMAGNLLGKAAVLFEGKNAAMVTAYGVESRGTFTKSDVIISELEIDFPEVLDADAVIALDVVAYKRYAESLHERALLIYDDKIKHLPSKAKQEAYPISRIARENGNPSSVNIVALAILTKLTGLVDEGSVRNAITEEFRGKPSFAEQNIAVFDASIRSLGGA